MALLELLPETKVGDYLEVSVHEDVTEERVVISLAGAEVSSVVVLEYDEWASFVKAITKAGKKDLQTPTKPKGKGGKEVVDLDLANKIIKLVETREAEEQPLRRKCEKVKKIAAAIEREGAQGSGSAWAIAKSTVAKAKRKRKKKRIKRAIEIHQMKQVAYA